MLVVAAGVLAIPVLVVLLIGVALWFSQLGFSPIAAHFLAAFAGAIVSLIVGLIGKSSSALLGRNFCPRKTSNRTPHFINSGATSPPQRTLCDDEFYGQPQ
jgi:hypothetical protein